MLLQPGPLLIAANHPNSFLDAIIVDSLFKSPVYSLARGDAFASKMITKILRSFHMLPVYRMSEGIENLANNYMTFDTCETLFKKNKVVLIFSEGGSKNEWHLRPLKKGTARLALHAWRNNIPLKVLPLGINYSSFRYFGKNMFLNFGNVISKKQFSESLSEGKFIKIFDEKLKEELKKLVYEIEKNDHEKLKDHFFIKQPLARKIFLFIPAILGFIINMPLYLLIHLIIKKRANDHYDSIMTGALILFYPLYVLAIALITYFITKSLYSFVMLIFVPVSAWSYLQLKNQIR